MPYIAPGSSGYDWPGARPTTEWVEALAIPNSPYSAQEHAPDVPAVFDATTGERLAPMGAVDVFEWMWRLGYREPNVVSAPFYSQPPGPLR
ncbi:hypothetical protein [Bauldia sp.]|uniref:hypothetical protein n=1 Tax=Bauldia sp. TaxID=2575872 RepID=UPI003BA9BB46